MQTSSNQTGSVLITGPTRGLGRSLVSEIARRSEADRPDMLLVGRPGDTLKQVAATARSDGATVQEIPCDLSSLADVRSAAVQVNDLLDQGAVGPLRALVANAGWYSADTRMASVDGYEMTFAVNYLAHVQLIGDLLDSFSAPARIVLLGSNTYRSNVPRRILKVPAAVWRDPMDLARPAPAEKPSGLQRAGVAYADAKLAILYYSHELQRHVGDGIRVAVFEPGFMPGTGLSRQQAPFLQSLGRAAARLPGVTTPSRSAPALASIALDDRWAHLSNGAFVVIDKETEIAPFAHDHERERRLWEASNELLAKAVS